MQTVGLAGSVDQLPNAESRIRYGDGVLDELGKRDPLAAAGRMTRRHHREEGIANAERGREGLVRLWMECNADVCLAVRDAHGHLRCAPDDHTELDTRIQLSERHDRARQEIADDTLD